VTDDASTGPLAAVDGEGAGGELRLGIVAGVAAYGIWGFFPIYFHLLSPAGPVEILCHRILWSLVVMAAALTWRRDFGWIRPLLGRPRQLAELALAAVLIAVNWLIYVWAVEQDRVVDAALGYFINPLVTVMLAVVLLGERLRRLQWVAVGLGGVAVAVIAVGYGEVPYVALALAFSFAGYGFLKKRVTITPAQSLSAETAILAPAAAVAMVVLAQGNGIEFGSDPKLSLLLATSGLVTAVPLVFFAASARRIPLTMLGLLQYLTPTLQFLCGVFVFQEPMSSSRWVGFALVWVALMCMSFDAVRSLRSGEQVHDSDEAVVAAAADLG
jgi:chloramphenicol-sensitive protein RarD